MAMKSTRVMPRGLTGLVHETVVVLARMVTEDERGLIAEARTSPAFIDISDGDCDSQPLWLFYNC